MKKIFIFIICILLEGVNPASCQQDSIENSTFEKHLKMIKLLSDTQQYSEAMRKLKAIENSNEIKKSIKNEVEYRLLVARVLRLSNQFDDAMLELNMLPNLDDEKELKLEVNFRKAALYMENPKYSIENRIEIVHPIIDKGIKLAEEINSKESLASFYNLKASIYYDEYLFAEGDCIKNKELAGELYIKSMALFLEVQDTLNYHNVLNGFFRLSIDDKKPEIDSVKNLVVQYTENSEYFPNVTSSRNLLGHYYLLIKHDSLGYFRQTILEKNAMIDAVNKNADNTIGKLKLLYEFDSLKADLNLNKDVIAQKDLMIKEKNRRIIENITFSIVLLILALILIFLFLRQRRLSKKLSVSNIDLESSNHNYQLLMKESHHRIKNNLQMILSIIELNKEGTSEENEMALTNVSSKILTIAALHRILDFKEHNQKVKLRDYFDEIIAYFENLSKNEIVFSTDFANPEIESERIIYLGLILNEIISNTIKHRGSKDEIIIRVLRSARSYVFIYRDNSDFKEYNKHNGINLIEDLIVRFGGVDLKFDSKYGEYKFYFDD